MNKNEKKLLKELSNLLKTAPASKEFNQMYAEGLDMLIEHDEERKYAAITISVFVYIFTMIGLMCTIMYLLY